MNETTLRWQARIGSLRSMAGATLLAVAILLVFATATLIV